MTFRTLRVTFNMNDLFIIMSTIVFVAASLKEKPIQSMKTIDTAGKILEYQLENREPENCPFIEVLSSYQDGAYFTYSGEDFKNLLNSGSENWHGKKVAIKTVDDAGEKVKGSAYFWEKKSNGDPHFHGRWDPVSSMKWQKGDKIALASCTGKIETTVGGATALTVTETGTTAVTGTPAEIYVLRAANDLCSTTGIIDNLDECKSGIRYLKEHGVNVFFEATESDARYPKGCYKARLHQNAFWNTHISGNVNDNAKPICKEDYILLKSDNECKSNDKKLGDFTFLEECAEACGNMAGCIFFIYGKTSKQGRCYWEKTSDSTCTEGWEENEYDFYKFPRKTTVGGATALTVTETGTTAVTGTPAINYVISTGECRGGNSPENYAGRQYFGDRDCRERCNMNALCTGFQLPVSWGKLCYTFTSIGATGNGVLHVGTCYMKGCFEHDFAYPGNDLGQKKTVLSPQDCQQLCQQTDGCVVFTFRANENGCWLKHIKSGGVISTGAISGNRECEELVAHDGWCRDERHSSDEFSYSDENTIEDCKEKCYRIHYCAAFSYETPTPSDFYNCYMFQGGPYTTGSGRPNTNCYVPERKPATTTAAPAPPTLPALAPATTTPETFNIFKFNETCCKGKGVSEECMGLCGEKTADVHRRRRSVDVFPIDRCVEHQTHIDSCVYQYVPAVDCEWNDWQIGECSVTCAGGSRTNSRTKKVEESDGTDEDGTCEGDARMAEDCNTQDCPH